MTMSPTCPFTIYIDTAEQHPFPFVSIRADADKDIGVWKITTEKRCLGRHPNSLGDYSLAGGIGRCHVERKSMVDLQSTLLGFSDGHRARFESEMENLSRIESALLVVECTKDDFLKNAPDYGKKSTELNAKILYRSVMAIAQDYRVQVEWSGSRRMAELDTFRWLYRFWEKVLKPEQKAKKILESV
jgi:hypothetical protein